MKPEWQCKPKKKDNENYDEYKERMEEFKCLYENNIEIKLIADHYGVNLATIHRWAAFLNAVKKPKETIEKLLEKRKKSKETIEELLKKRK